MPLQQSNKKTTPSLLQIDYSLPTHHPSVLVWYKFHSLPLLLTPPVQESDDEEDLYKCTDAQQQRPSQHRKHQHAESEEEEDTEPEEDSSDEEEEREPVIKKRHRPAPGSTTPSSKKTQDKKNRNRGTSQSRPSAPSAKRQQQDSETEDTDSRAPRKPLGNIYVQQQKLHRIATHPTNTMARTNKHKKGAAASRKSARQQDPDDDDTTTAGTTITDISQAEYMMAQRKLTALQADLAAYKSQPTGRKAAKDKTAAEKEVMSVSKTILFKKCKAMDENSWKKKVEFVMNWINPKEFEGVPPALLTIAQKCWIARHQDFVSQHVFLGACFRFSYACCLCCLHFDTNPLVHPLVLEQVRVGINERRNNIQQEMTKHHKKVRDEPTELALFPASADEVYELIFREGLDEKDEGHVAKREKFDYLVDKIIPKFAGCDSWGDNHKYTTPMYCCKNDPIGDRDPTPSVSIGDLAFCWIWFDNYLPVLEWERKKAKDLLEKWEDGNQSKVFMLAFPQACLLHLFVSNDSCCFLLPHS